VPADLERKRAAAEALLAAEPMEVPATVEELKAELDELRSRRADDAGGRHPGLTTR
jgi:hypothetical protein